MTSGDDAKIKGEVAVDLALNVYSLNDPVGALGLKTIKQGIVGRLKKRRSEKADEKLEALLSALYVRLEHVPESDRHDFIDDSLQDPQAQERLMEAFRNSMEALSDESERCIANLYAVYEIERLPKDSLFRNSGSLFRDSESATLKFIAQVSKHIARERGDIMSLSWDSSNQQHSIGDVNLNLTNPVEIRTLFKYGKDATYILSTLLNHGFGYHDLADESRFQLGLTDVHVKRFHFLARVMQE